MNISNKPLNLQSLLFSDILNIYYDSTGQLILVQKKDLAKVEPHKNNKKLSIKQQSHLKAAFYWLNIYKPEPNASNLEKVRGYLEAFQHFCEISAWQEASQLLFISTHASKCQKLYTQLKSWGCYLEQIELYTQILGKINPEIDCFCLTNLGLAYRCLGKIHKAIDLYKQKLEIANKTNNKVAKSQALGELGIAYFAQEQYQQAIKLFKQQLSLAREINAKKEEGYALAFLGANALYRGSYQRGIKYCEEALNIAHALSDLEMEGEILGYLGGTHMWRRRYKQSITYLQQQLEISIQIDNQCQKFSALYYLGTSYFLIGEVQLALECLNKSIDFAHETAFLLSEAVAVSALGGVYSNYLKQYKKAIQCFEKVLKISCDLDNKKLQASTLSSLAYCYGCIQQHHLAVEYVNQSLAIAAVINSKEEKAMALAALANTYWQQQQYIKALGLILKSLLLVLPWANPNSELILRKTIEEVVTLTKKLIKPKI
jgi:tetratricopeptide (TPR) repeat protein